MGSSDPSLTASLGVLDFAMLGAYLLVTLAIVVWASRRDKTTEDYFLGGRRMPWLAVGLSIMATMLSSLTYLGLPGEVVKNGVAAFAVQLAIFPAMIIIIPVVIPFFMRLRLTSAYEYLEHRFNYQARLLGGALFLCLRLGWVSLVMYAGSLALAEIAGWDLVTTIIVLGVIATIYTCFGGMEAAVWTDVLQAVMLFGGAFLVIFYVWFQTGDAPLAWWAEISQHATHHTTPQLFSLNPTVRVTVITAIINGFFWQLCTHCSDQVVLQRYASTPTYAAARNSYLTNTVAAFMMASLLTVAGLALLHFYAEFPASLRPGTTAVSASDKLLLHFYSDQLPVGFAGLILANFLCDAMQTLVSGVNSLCAVASKDVIERLRPDRSTQGARLQRARWLALGLGFVCTVLAVGVVRLVEVSGENILGIMPKTFNMFLGPLGSLFLIGMFMPRATARSAIPAVLLSLAVSIAWSYCRQIFGTSFDLSIMWAIAVPCLVGWLTAALLSLIVDSDADHPGRRYTWAAVMSRPPVVVIPVHESWHTRKRRTSPR